MSNLEVYFERFGYSKQPTTVEFSYEGVSVKLDFIGKDISFIVWKLKDTVIKLFGKQVWDAATFVVRDEELFDTISHRTLASTKPLKDLFEDKLNKEILLLTW